MQRRVLVSVGALWLAGLPVAAAARPQLLEFWASWCGTCRAMEPTVAALKKRWGDRIEVRIVDVDDPKNAELLRRYRIPGTAIFVLLDRDGREVFRESGQVPQAVFEAEFKKVLGA